LKQETKSSRRREKKGKIWDDKKKIDLLFLVGLRVGRRKSVLSDPGKDRICSRGGYAKKKKPCVGWRRGGKLLFSEGAVGIPVREEGQAIVKKWQLLGGFDHQD